MSDGFETDLRTHLAAELCALRADGRFSANFGFKPGVHLLRGAWLLGVLAQNFEAEHFGRIEIYFAHECTPYNGLKGATCYERANTCVNEGR